MRKLKKFHNLPIRNGGDTNEIYHFLRSVMKRIFQSLVSRWFATMVPVHVPATTLAARENMRKRRLLSIILGISCLSTLAYLGLGFTLSSSQLLICSVEAVILLGTLWLNRQGYLKIASVLFFFSSGFSSLMGTHTVSSSDPFMLLWTCFVMTIFLSALGLFLSPWMLLVLAVIENLILFWYLLVVCHTQMVHLLSPLSLQSFLIYLAMLIYESAIIGILYAVTTKKAVVQADRATELEEANRALTAAHASLEEAYATIQRQALTDGLTGLPNHRAVMDQLQKELERARRHGRPFSVLFFDADRFKKVNDTHGHAVGDAVLCEIGVRAGSVLRGGDTLGRFGGEEFVVLLPEADGSEARMVAERIRAAVAAGPVASAEVEGGIAATVSIGLATYPADGPSEEDLLSQADEAMYLAKRLGRNQVRTAEEARHMSADVEMMVLLQHEGQREAVEREGITPERLRETYTLRTICSLMTLLDRRDAGLSSHAYAVSDLATAIAGALGLDPKDVSRIGMAALIHDIGKVAVPDVLLQKSTALSSQERVLLQEHAELGAQILEASPFLCDLMPMVRYHHERWDGYGYPDQLRGEDIPLAARIITVAEAYDTMLRDHPYQAGRGVEEALREVQRCAGTQFDPAVVQAFSGLLVQQPTRLPSIQLVG
jgi:diguanylate cyclase (GGDEF)-like protein/putative nucleotidyltransferase with HDIG domain